MTQLFLARLVIVLGLCWCLSRVRRAWRGPRSCPSLPLLPNLPAPGWEGALYPLFFALLTVIAVSPAPTLPILAWIALVAISCLYDYTRLLPWFYQYSFMLGAMALHYAGAMSASETLHICRLINISIYFWSGVLKANRYFFQTGFLGLMNPLLKSIGEGWRPLFRWLGYLAPFAEAALAIGLLFPQTRWPSMLAALLMHAFILLSFSSLGRSTHRTIWPWNITMGISTVVLFAVGAGGPGDILWGEGAPLHLVVLLLFFCLPVLGLFNKIENIFSHGYMTGRHTLGYLRLTPAFRAKLPPEIQSFCREAAVPCGQSLVLDLGQWYVSQLAMNPPQNEHMLMAIARDFRKYGAAYDDFSLVITGMPGLFSAQLPQKEFSWSQLFNEKRQLDPGRRRLAGLKARQLKKSQS
ncbi:MAG: hypothetical protein U0931_12590 [Vulcanimicrobiota bacterium]